MPSSSAASAGEARRDGARDKPAGSTVGEPQDDGIRTGAGGQRVGERSQPFVQAGRPGEAPLGPFWIDHCHGVLPLSDGVPPTPS